MTAGRIKEAALAQFAQSGFDGASLAQIAQEVGIKKPSIYAHFKGKDDLFLAVFSDVINDEMEFIRRYFTGKQQKSDEEQSLKERLYHFLEAYVHRYEHDVKTKFFLRMTFFPPGHLYETVMVLVYDYLDRFEELLLSVFSKAVEEKQVVDVDARFAAIAFMGVLDAVLVELLYGGPDRFARRLQASWAIFWRGLECTPSNEEVN